MKALITGFEPYGEEDYNPTYDLAKKLSGQKVGDVEIVGATLPVSFRRVREILVKHIEDVKPSIIINLGLAPRTTYIRVERVAINIMDSGPDNDGYKPEDEPIDPNGPAAYFATIPIKKIVEALRKEGIPASVSNTAGTFLCNCTMYHTLHYISTKGLNAIAGFIHIPYTPKQAAEKPPKSFLGMPPPSMPLDIVEKAVKIAIKVSSSHLDVGK
ncbi:MAG: pyroglutamyl-peptidase I [Candidatus Methanomethylicota archaeon]|uniref:Pyrrolidone-carboxylate peptidase n=1 Tax=Thermoproteota archaeon TaxID=2056631 RepID=A0A497F0Y7_9CREN|nr:MAG: pyroglutamyl-peptidase I [Candidatus Verstraetearchaeota archaeon]